MRPAEELRYLILAAQREGNRRLARALRPLEVTPSQAEVLRLLQERQPLTLSQLGEMLVCETGASPSRLVDRLVTAGMVERVEAESDRRQVMLTLTAAGRRLARRIATIEDQLYRQLDAVGQERDMARVIAYLRAFVADAPAGVALARRKAEDGNG